MLLSSITATIERCEKCVCFEISKSGTLRREVRPGVTDDAPQVTVKPSVGSAYVVVLPAVASVGLLRGGRVGQEWKYASPSTSGF